jgi:oligogalacturonide lyase
VSHERQNHPAEFPYHGRQRNRPPGDPDDAPHVICHRNYFYQKCFTRDGSKLIFGGGFEGHWNYYLLDIAAQQATQLTDGPGDNTFGGFLSADDRTLWYVKNNQQLRRVDLATREEQVVYSG